ncbi:MAG TPA: saccharopine dehydrogenase NADP-binding domain-containing protein [Burkholderiaceae bacterium]|nr:saccharopine dehydrogenase NADP-binding domain-containing protein [Burkholderiaceae bacterium]
MKREFDLIVFGATGFTGRLVAQYLLETHGVGGALTWAMAGRNPDKLAATRRDIGAPQALPLLQADASDPAALAALVSRAGAVLSTVGPYQLHGEPLVRACAQAGTDYVDLCGEPGWMARMIAQYDAPARASGARIVFSCGFDSIPFDLGVLFLQDEAMRRFGAPLTRVRGRVRVMKGTFSGGTIASALASIEAARRDRDLARVMADPFALTPGFRGPAQPEGDSAAYDDAAQSWTAPFVMAAINTKNVHRTNALRGHPWGRDFVYDERMLTGDGERGARRARALARNSRVQMALLGWDPTRELLRRFALPKPGQGPTPQQRESGRYEVAFIGDTEKGQRLRATVKGDRDPGYGSTCKLVAESALCLGTEIDRSMTGGGVWTAGAAMGMPLVRRLQERAGLSFVIED